MSLRDMEEPVAFHSLQRAWDMFSLNMNGSRNASLRETGWCIPTTSGELLVPQVEKGPLFSGERSKVPIDHALIPCYIGRSDST